MNEAIPPSNRPDTPDTSEWQRRAAAEAERRGPPIPQGGPGPYQPYPPNPSYPPYQPYPPSAPYAAGGRGGRRRERVSPAVIVAGVVLVALGLCLALAFVAAGILQGMAWAAGTERATDTRTFAVAGTPSLVLDVSAGNVHVVPGATGQVSAKLTKEVSAITRTAGRQALDAISIDATQAGDTIRIGLRYPIVDGFPTWVNRNVELTVSVPANANLDLTLSAGNLDATGITGTVVGRVSAGNLDLRGMTLSGNSSLHVTAGNVTYTGALAPQASLDVVVTAGNVTISLPLATPTYLEASATAGNLTVHGWPRLSSTRSGGGSITGDLNPQPTSTLSVQVTAGNVTVQPVA